MFIPQTRIMFARNFFCEIKKWQLLKMPIVNVSLIIRMNIDVRWVERSETQQFNRLESPKELDFTYFFGNIDLK